MDEEAALSCVTNTTYNMSSQVKFPQLIKGKYNDTFILLTVMILKIKSFKVFLSLQDQASCWAIGKRVLSVSERLWRIRLHTVPPKEARPESVISMIISETFCLRSKMLQQIWQLEECILYNSRQHFLKCPHISRHWPPTHIPKQLPI